MKKIILIIFSLLTLMAKGESGLNEDLDNYIKKQMESENISALTLSIVKDGKVYYAKNYGFMDGKKGENEISADALFEIGSVTKIFTSTAIMKLYEEGKLDLEDEVNRYLKINKVKYYNNKPIKIKHLLTHTAGFDEYVVDLFKDHKSDQLRDIGEFLSKNMPKPIREPGQIYQYSNHGIAMLGLIVENISGERIDKYIENNIFEPLKMENSYYYLTSKNIKKRPNNYIKNCRKEGCKFIEQKPIEITVHPAGSILSNGKDMAKFMISHMDESILNKTTLDLMHKTHFTHNKFFTGSSYGFYNTKIGELKNITHNGGTFGFSSLMTINKKNRFGVFISNNMGNTAKFNEQIVDYIFRKNFKIIPEKEHLILDDEKEIKNIFGHYARVNAIENGPVKIAKELEFLSIELKKIDDKTILLKVDSEITRYEKIANNYYKEDKTGVIMYIKNDNEGRIYICFDGNYALEKVNNMELLLSLPKYIFPMINFILGIIVIIALIFTFKTGGEKLLKTASIIQSYFFLIFPILYIIILHKTGNNNMEFSKELSLIKISSYLYLLLTLYLSFIFMKNFNNNSVGKFLKTVYGLQIFNSILAIISMVNSNMF